MTDDRVRRDATLRARPGAREASSTTGPSRRTSERPAQRGRPGPTGASPRPRPQSGRPAAEVAPVGGAGRADEPLGDGRGGHPPSLKTAPGQADGRACAGVRLLRWSARGARGARARTATGGVVVRVAASGICRSDWHAWQGHDPDIVLPHVPGHELAGTVAAVGTGVREWSVGDRVTVPFVNACGTCARCAAGEQQVCARQTQPGLHPLGLPRGVRRPRRRRRQPRRRPRRARPGHRRRARLPVRHGLPGGRARGAGAGRGMGGGARLRGRGAVRRADRGGGRCPGDRRRRRPRGARPRPRPRGRAHRRRRPRTCPLRSSS